ncbi:latexin isoform X1 [Hypanus sabinus]|uniref:latexin isoform X1 n=1 Tax=Hypanus sabinus TaxID=79690 RepID=UPI0028C4C6D3|nr:latexin isoform X1 [Hypanus sabinus]
MYSIRGLVICVLLSLNGLSKSNDLEIPGTNTEISVGNRLAHQAASVAIHYLNYRHGSPYRLYQLHKLKEVHREGIFNLGNKYHLEFEVKNESSSNVTETCVAHVSFYKKNTPDVSLQCDLRDLKNDSLKKENEFFFNLRNKEDPVIGGNIPDNFGFISPEMMPIWQLSKVSASYIMWQKSTEIKRYNMLQIRKINQWIKTDKFLQFTYTVLLHEIPTQEIIICNMWVMWKPEHSPMVKYTCLPSPSKSSSEESELGRTESPGFQVPEQPRSQVLEHPRLQRR